MNTPTLVTLALALATSALAQPVPPPPRLSPPTAQPQPPQFSPANTQSPPPPGAPNPPPRTPPGPPRQAAPGGTGGPLLGLTTAEMTLFRDGLNGFRQIETVDSGLGPIFNDVSCLACHNAGGVGGGSRRTITRFGRTTNGHFDPLTSRGGSMLQQRAIEPAFREVIPAEANTVARRVSTPVFGAGLIEAIPDATLLAAAAATKPDGVRGRAALINDVTTGRQRVGRFGWKAQHATLLAFTADAYSNEMGITNRFFPEENAPNGNTALLDRADQITDPEDETNPATGRADIDRTAAFMRLLAAPTRGPITSDVIAGESLFASLNCTTCHTPSLTTGASSIAALSRKRVPLYSDLLLHDMGALGDGIAQGPAGPRDLRTPPLWGLASRPTYLHDGRTDSLHTAIRAHAGEATPSRNRYVQLPEARQQQLIAFLRSL